MKRLLQTILRSFTKLILWKYKPTIIAITGSVGKTSTKEAIFAVLATQIHSRKSENNYNNEIGVPLSVIGARSGNKNILRWFWVLLKGLVVFVFPLPYPKVLVLEMAADRPGDIAYLSKLATPFISVVTTVGPSHLKYFKRIEKIASEKSGLVEALPSEGVAVLNYDDQFVQAMAMKHSGISLLFGLDKDADLLATDIYHKEDGLAFKLHYHGNVVPIHLPGVIGLPNVYVALAAAGVGLAMNMNLVEVSRALGEYQSPPGRLRLLPGVKSTLIIDDTYNAAPASAVAALEALSKLPGNRKIAVLGDMAELGEFTEDGHRNVGAKVVDYGINWLVVVGPKSKFIADQAKHMGYPEKSVLEFETADEARKPVENLIEPGDIVLIKGSQSVRMEKIVKEIMAEPHRAGELLCRQDKTWLNK